MQILYVVLKVDSGAEEDQQVFKALRALGYDGRYAPGVGLAPTIEVHVHKVTVEMPKRVRITAAGVQYGHFEALCIRALADMSQPLKKRKFLVTQPWVDLDEREAQLVPFRYLS